MKNKITSVKVRIRDEIASNVTLRITYFIYYSLQRKKAPCEIYLARGL